MKSSMIFRLEAQPNEWIDRQRKIHFEFEGKTYEAYAGDSISSALWANGEKVLGRSFKYHRPRGLFSLANHDINVLLENNDETHIRGDVTLVKDGMSLRATNTQGGLANDRYRWLSKLSKLMPVGFYYKAFFTPRFLFPYWERILRNTAGLGKVNLLWKRRITPKWYEHTDLAVIGAGPSGMQAALTAADYGIKVILVDENPHIGGSLDYAWDNNAESIALRTRLKEQVVLHPKITIKTSTLSSSKSRVKML
ncbi:MAG: 2Fe-2S iron-sulfur cluster-binding protein [Thiotrichales bacterium]